MKKWLLDIGIGVAVLSVIGPILFALDAQHMTLLERQAQADPTVLEACSEIAASARGPFAGSVKEQCLMKFDRHYAAARASTLQK